MYELRFTLTIVQNRSVYASDVVEESTKLFCRVRHVYFLANHLAGLKPGAAGTAPAKPPAVPAAWRGAGHPASAPGRTCPRATCCPPRPRTADRQPRHDLLEAWRSGKTRRLSGGWRRADAPVPTPAGRGLSRRPSPCAAEPSGPLEEPDPAPRRRALRDRASTRSRFPRHV